MRLETIYFSDNPKDKNYSANYTHATQEIYNEVINTRYFSNWNSSYDKLVSTEI